MGDVIDFCSRLPQKHRPDQQELVASGQGRISEASNQFFLAEVDALVETEIIDDEGATVDMFYIENLRVVDPKDGTTLYGVDGLTYFMMNGIEWLNVEQFIYEVQNLLIADLTNPITDTDLLPPPRTFLVNQIHFRSIPLGPNFDGDTSSTSPCWRAASYHDLAKWCYLRNVSDFFVDRIPELKLEK
jgi:hypothetical protein